MHGFDKPKRRAIAPDAFRRLADVARVPRKQMPSYREKIAALVDNLWINDRRLTDHFEASDRRSAARLIKRHGGALREVLKRASKGARQAVAHAFDDSGERGLSESAFAEMTKFEKRLEQLVESAAFAAKPMKQVYDGGRLIVVRKFTKAAQKRFLERRFLLRLSEVTVASGGRKLTLDKNSPRSTLPDALRILLPHLPPALFSDSPSTLSRRTKKRTKR